MGLTGFDSETKRLVSMQCIAEWHSNIIQQKFNWRK